MTNKYLLSTTPPARNWLLLTFISFLISFSHISIATEEKSSFSPSPFAVQDEEFLLVDEAYQLSVRQTDTHIIAEWMISDKYFLYGEQFHFSINGQAIAGTLPPGKISYDPIFEKEVEKYYIYAQAKMDKAQLPADQNIQQLAVRYQGCADAGLCYPPEVKTFEIDIAQATITPITQATISATTSTTAPITQQTNSRNTTHLFTLLMILSALLGGALLNLMPCVFPVLSIKALSLANNTDQQSRIKHGWSYTLGCLVTFVLVAALLLAIRDAGKSVGWGFQLQEPAVITFLALLFFIMGLSLSGLVSFGARWMGAGQTLTQGKGLSHSFFTGVLAAVVASPCTAPFMATALGYALTQPTLIALSIFASLGLGMALPFLLLSYVPQFSRLLPAPGVWMETFKQAIAFPLYITSAWLLWVLGRQIGHDAVILVILVAISISFIFWLTSKKPTWSLIANTIVIVLVASIIWHNKHQSPNAQHATLNDEFWQPYSTQQLRDLRQQGSAVFINLTADWCITCKVNEKLVFTPSTLELMKNKRIHLLLGDWTNYNAEITDLLDQYGRGGVPLYLLFPAKIDAEAKVLPQILNPSDFKKLINEF